MKRKMSEHFKLCSCIQLTKKDWQIMNVCWGWGTYRAFICACEVSMEILGCLKYYSIKLWENLGEKGEFVEGI